jgi:hypothetical protein
MESVVQWFIDNKEICIGALAVLLSVIFPKGRSLWAIMFEALWTSKQGIRLVIWGMDKITKSTRTGIDDMVWAPVRKRLFAELAKK